MDLAKVISRIYPYANPETDFVIRDDADGSVPYIDKEQWLLKEPIPSDEELQAVWQEILEESPEVRNPSFERRVKAMEDAFLEMMMKETV